MGCGIPVIVGDVDAIYDVVQHEKNGLIVNPRDTTKLAQQMVRLLQNPSLRVQLAESGRAHCIQEFDWSIAAQRYLRILKELHTSAS